MSDSKLVKARKAKSIEMAARWPYSAEDCYRVLLEVKDNYGQAEVRLQNALAKAVSPVSKPSPLLEAFIAASEHGQLTQREVARELVIMLTHYSRLTPPVLQRVCVRLGMPMNHEAGEMIAWWLQQDGWILTSAKPFAGRGMSAVQAYEPTDKWRRLVDRVTRTDEAKAD